MTITVELNIDLRNQGFPQRIRATQADANTRVVEVSLYDGGAVWPIPDGVAAAVGYRKPDGTAGLYDKLPDGTSALTISENTVTAILAPQVLTAPGIVSAVIILTDDSMRQLSTFPFHIYVEKNPAAGLVVSDNYINVVDAIGDLNTLVTDDKSSLVAAINEIARNNGGTISDEQIAQAVADYLAENPIEGGYPTTTEITDESTDEEVPTAAAVREYVGSHSGGNVGLTDDLKTALINYYTHVMPNFDDDNGLAYINAILTALGAETRAEESEEDSHTHSYTAVVTTAATCTTAGVRTYTCSCGDIYTESIPATGHNFVDGVCTVCGAADSDYNPDVTLTSISATYSGGEVDVGTAVTDLTGVMVTATYSDGSTKTVTGYTLSGTIVEGDNTITVSYEGLTTTFTVNGIAEATGEPTVIYMRSGDVGFKAGTATSEPVASDGKYTSDAIYFPYEKSTSNLANGSQFKVEAVADGTISTPRYNVYKLDGSVYSASFDSNPANIPVNPNGTEIVSTRFRQLDSAVTITQFIVSNVAVGYTKTYNVEYV